MSVISQAALSQSSQPKRAFRGGNRVKGYLTDRLATDRSPDAEQQEILELLTISSSCLFWKTSEPF